MDNLSIGTDHMKNAPWNQSDIPDCPDCGSNDTEFFDEDETGKYYQCNECGKIIRSSPSIDYEY